MIKRRNTITVKAGSVKIGSSAPIVIQSMTKVPTTDIASCVRQIKQLTLAGCRLVRVAVPRRADTVALKKIISRTDTPVIADIHFSPDRAVEAIQAGAVKIRLNPGNIKNPKDIKKIIDAAKVHKTAIRIGVNEASIRDLSKQQVPLKHRTALMIKELGKYIRIFEKQNFTNIVLSAKSSDTYRTIEVNRAISAKYNYPIHLGLTHAGLPRDAEIPSAVALGTLLAEGIGDTIRISAAGNPVIETEIAKKILISLGLYQRSTPELIVCPTCARAEMDVIAIAKKIEKSIQKINSPVRIAVMGCIVNGPGEAADADLALCIAKNKAYLYKNGKRIAIVAQSKMIPAILKHIKNL